MRVRYGGPAQVVVQPVAHLRDAVIDLALAPDGYVWGISAEGEAAAIEGRSATVLRPHAGLVAPALGLHAGAGDTLYVVTTRQMLRTVGASLMPVGGLYEATSAPIGPLNRRWVRLFGGRTARLEGGQLHVESQTSAWQPMSAAQVTWKAMPGGSVLRWGIDTLHISDSEPPAAVLVDREGVLWTGDAQGLQRYVRRTVAALGPNNGLRVTTVSALHAFADSSVLLGTFGGGLLRWTRRGVEAFGPSLEGLSVVHGLAVDRAGRAWASNPEGVLFVTQPAGASVRVAAPKGCGTTWAVLFARTSGEVVGACDYPARFVPERGSWRLVVDSSGPTGVRTLAEDARGQLWAGTTNGLYHQSSDGRWFRVPEVGNASVEFVFHDRRGVLWAGLRSMGVFRRDPSGKTFLYTARHGLHHARILTILPDGMGFFWMASDGAGVGRYALANLDAVAAGRLDVLHPLVLTSSDGMPSDEVNLATFGSARDVWGRLWFSTANGVGIIEPAHYPASFPPPSVYIEQLWANERPVGMPRRLPVGTHSLRVAFSASSLMRPASTRFRYRLEGAGAGSWSAFDTVRTATFTGLKPGDYHLYVEAVTSQGAVSIHPATYAFVLPPPLWRHPLVLLALALAILSGLWAIWRMRVRYLYTVELERLVHARTAELQASLDTMETQKHEIADQNAYLEEQDRNWGRVLENVAHELRTPLTVLLGTLSDLPNPSEAPRCDARLEAASERAGLRVERLLGHLFDAVRSEEGIHTRSRCHADLGLFAKDVVALFEPVADQAGVTLSFASAEPLPVLLDPEATETILFNLVGNAIKFTPHGGAVQVVCSRAGAEARVVVRDTGIGLAPEDVGQVMGHFFQAPNPSTLPHKGVGLGLALAHDLACAQGGRLGADSEGLGCGARFTFAMPCTFGSETASLPIQPDADHALLHLATSRSTDGMACLVDPRPLVLVVDDEADVRYLVRLHLGDAYRYAEATSGREALALIRREPPALVLSDLDMNYGDGVALLEALRSDPSFAALPVLLLRARTEVDALEHDILNGAVDYLAKPFMPAELRARAAALLRRHHALHDEFSLRVVVPGRAQPVLAKEVDFVETLHANIRMHLGDATLDVSRLAYMQDLSASQLTRRLRALTGESPAKLVQRLRLEQAAQLLLARKGTVHRIALAVGYTNDQHFSRLFRAHFDCSPSQYASRAMQV